MKGAVIMRVLLSLLLVVALVGEVFAQAAPSKRWPPGPTLDEPVIIGERGTTAEEVVRRVFSEIERRIIERYFGKDENGKKKKGKSKSLPPGLAKRATLPPGLAKHVQRHGTLPPGLQKRTLPAKLEALLPPGAPGTKRVIVGNDVMLIEKATGLILDVIEDVLTKKKDEGSSDAQ
ncbi:MAG: hypothetical protein ACE5H5_03305 [Nitrospinota bacterium]